MPTAPLLSQLGRCSSARLRWVCVAGIEATPARMMSSAPASTLAHTAAAAAASDTGVTLSRSGSTQVVLLNRPKALNSLNLDMVRALARSLAAWSADPTIHAVILKGAGGKAFCAGGDIKSLWGGKGASLQRDFFAEEYALDLALAENSQQSQPHIAMLDGVVMGGGVGISINAAVRIATEATVFAMPETGIGFFPDVGGSHFLPRLPGNLGVFLALTGHRLKGGDVQHAGVATHFVPRDSLPACEAALAGLRLREDAPGARAAAITEALAEFARPAPAPTLTAADLAFINAAFQGGDVEAIVDRVEAAAAGSSLAQEAAKALRRASPTSLKVTLEQMRRGARLSLRECYAMELRVALRCMAGVDFYEGVRAALVDKDGAPVWQPPSLRAVSQDAVDAYFQPLPPDLELALPALPSVR